ncbi:MAG TPA: hypothetical protein DCE43_04430 [Planctomycetaceae bacterium]|nr:hypothetical protein [Planctomycetaceae bacterium]
MIAQFAIRLICGMSLAWCLTPRRQITDGFFRIQMLITLGLSVLACLAHLGGWNNSIPQMAGEPGSAWGIHTHTWLCGATAIVAYVGSFTWALGRRRIGTVCIVLITALALVLLVQSARTASSTSLPMSLMVVASELSTALLLGAAMVSMLLGHWYLTATGMPLAPLKRLNLVLGVATLLRIALAIIGFVLIGGLPESDHQRLLLSLRWLAGLVSPLVVVVMVSRILEYRNTQSATGVLYVGVVLILTGELTATLLAHELSMPV